MAKTLIKNGRVWNGEDICFCDVLTDGDRIEKIAPNIVEKCDFVFDASGKTVSPGLVDAHVHISGGEFGIHPAMCTLPFGVTAAADAGVCSPERLVNCGLKYTVFVSVGIKNNSAELTQTLKIMQECGDKAVGLKVYFDKTISEVRDVVPLKETVAFAEAHGLIVMVHSSNPPTSMKALLETLRPGDILTHAYHGGEGNVSEDGYECIKKAKARGVIIDAGLAGHVHTDFKVFGDAIKCGAIPDVISTDITRYSAYKRGGRYGLTMCMSIARHLGMAEADIFRAVTSNSAKALGKSNKWGYLKEGRTADIAILDYTNEGFELTDRFGNSVQNEMGYRNILTVLDGEIVYKY